MYHAALGARHAEIPYGARFHQTERPETPAAREERQMAMTSARPAALPATEAAPAPAPSSAGPRESASREHPRATDMAEHAESFTRADRSALLRFMLLMRATEERALTLYRQGKVPGSYYDGRGQ